MKKFMDEDFLLESEPAKILYNEYAKDLPIIDYHCHINPKELAKNTVYRSITDLWLAGDHYKWRLMRANGVAEELITGNADDYAKFEAFSEALQGAVGNPIYHWSHLELQRYFQVCDPLTVNSAKDIYDRCNQHLCSGNVSAWQILNDSNVAFVGTTDDPVDDLMWHKELKEHANLETKVCPTFRPDRLFTQNGEAFCQYLSELESASKQKISNFETLKQALIARMDYFDELGCRSSDHSFCEVPYSVASKEEISGIFETLRKGENVNDGQFGQFVTAMMLFLASEYAKRDWVMQLHFGVVRNSNTKMFGKVGKDSGFDRIHTGVSMEGLAQFLDCLDEKEQLPKTILYSLNPNDNAVLDVLCGCFSQENVKGKVQHGAAWWFNDHMAGMRTHLEDLASRGLLASFVGMLTDSRSMLSYTRHEYFRRILCNFVGEMVEKGEVAWSKEILGQMIQDICFYNAKRFFSL